MLEVTLISNPVADGWKNYLRYFGKLGREVNQMKESIGIQVGTKKSKETWNKTYKSVFLANNGWKFYELSGIRVCQYLATVQTKHGELVVHDGDSITYLGHNLWDVRKG